MAGNNSIQRFTKPKSTETQDTIGIVNYEGGGNKWNTTQGGIIQQGGIAPGAGPVTFSIPFPKQILYLHLVGGTASAVSLQGFTASGAGYWMAIGE